MTFIKVLSKRLEVSYLYNIMCCITIVLYNNGTYTLGKCLCLFQNRAARIITFSSYDVNADVVLANIDWKKLETQRKIQKAVMVHKSKLDHHF